jgi:hypothetical protein
MLLLDSTDLLSSVLSVCAETRCACSNSAFDCSAFIFSSSENPSAGGIDAILFTVVFFLDSVVFDSRTSRPSFLFSRICIAHPHKQQKLNMIYHRHRTGPNHNRKIVRSSEILQSGESEERPW